MSIFNFIHAESSPYGQSVDAAYRRYRMRVLVAITLGYGFIYTCRLALGVVKKPLIDAGIYTPAELGFIGSTLFYAYAVGKLSNGFLADHLNVRVFVTVGFALTALCNFGMGLTQAVWLAALLWGLNGWFQSFGAPSCVVAITAWFSNRERGRAYGIWSASHSIGEGLTFLVVGSMVAAFGWKAGFFVPALIGVATAMGMYAFIRGKPVDLGLPPVADWRNDHYRQAATGGAAEKGLFATQLSVMKIPSIWILALASALAYVTRYAVNSWGILYLQEAKGLSLPMAGTLLMVSTLSGAVGAIAFGFVSDKWFVGRRPPANFLFGLIEIAGLCLVFFGPDHVASIAVGMLLFGLGMTGLVTSLGGLFAIDIAPKKVAGAALGFIGIFSYVGSALQEQASGWLIEQGMTVVGEARHYDFDAAVLFWLASSMLSLLLGACLWKTELRD